MSLGDFHDGKCLCGTVGIRLHLPIIECYYCHCSQCRRLHASPLVTWIKAAYDRLELVHGSANLGSHDLTKEQRLFCNACGTVVFGQIKNPAKRNIVWVPRAMLSDDAGLTPTFHKYFASRAPWHEVSDNLPRFQENGTLEN